MTNSCFSAAGSRLARVSCGGCRLIPIIACGLVIGCGSNSPFDYRKISGKIRYDDDSAIPGNGVILRFASQDAPKFEDAFPRPAFAKTNAQGEFDCVTSYKYGDGLIPGKHKVAIEPQGSLDAAPPVPKEYLSISTTPLVIDTVELPLDIKVPKPKSSR